MNDHAELIALLVDEPETVADDTSDTTGAHRLLRSADGRIRLEPVASREEFDRIARDTGCFRRGAPIRDPKTSEVIGYEMEEITPGLAVVSG